MERTDRRARRRARRYLLTSALAAANTAFGLRPFPVPGIANSAAWIAPWLTSELPMAYLTGRAAVAAVMLRGGVLRTRAGKAGLALDIASAAGLLELQRRGKKSGGAVEAALADGLGPDYRERIRLPRIPGPDAATAKVPGGLRMLRIRSQFAHDADISYGPYGKPNELDICGRARDSARVSSTRSRTGCRKVSTNSGSSPANAAKPTSCSTDDAASPRRTAPPSRPAMPSFT